MRKISTGGMTAAMGVLLGVAAMSGANVVSSVTTASPTARAEGWRPGASSRHDQAALSRSPDQQAARKRWLASRSTRPGRAVARSTGSHKQNRRRALAGR